MDEKQLQQRIVERGTQFFAELKRQKPSGFSIKYWVNRVMVWSMGNEEFKQKLFGFIEKIPELNTKDMIYDYLREHFLCDDVPLLIQVGLRIAGAMGPFGKKIVSISAHIGISTAARQFIIGSQADETVESLRKLREKQGYAFTLDVLGEKTESEKNVNEYVDGYLEFLASVEKALPHWKSLGDGNNGTDWSGTPIVNVSVKPSALCVKADEMDSAEAAEQMLARLKPVYRKVIKLGGFLCIDMETFRLRETILELYRRLRSDQEFRDCPHLGFVLQVYLKDHEAVLDSMLAWARSVSLPISIRLVKGAYWDYEVKLAKANNEPVPVYTIKSESDIAFEQAAKKILQNSDICHLACGSHNVRSVVAVAEMARMLNVGNDRLEFQALYGIAEPFRKALLKKMPHVRLYCPYGNPFNGMAYLVRRLIENSSNESFLKMTPAKGADLNRLLENPCITLEREIKEVS